MEIKRIDWFDDHFYKIKVEGADQFIPSVTTKLGVIAKPPLYKWYADLGWEKARRNMNDAADRGSRIHHAWYTYTTAGAVIYQPWRFPVHSDEELDEIKQKSNNNYMILQNQNEMWDFCKLVEFESRINPVNGWSEIEVADIETNDAGTVDRVYQIEKGTYEINGSKPINLEKGLYIADLKTGTNIYEESKMQVSKYLQMCSTSAMMKMYEFPDNFKGALIIHTGAKTRSGIEGLATKFMPMEECLEYLKTYELASKLWERHGSQLKPKLRQLPSLIMKGA